MAAWLTGLTFVEALGWASALFVSLTLVSLAAGYAVERRTWATAGKIFDVPARRGQLRHEVIGTALFHVIWLPAVAGALASGLVRFSGGLGRELVTFFGAMFFFQVYYWLMHRAMHWRPLFFLHRWHHRSLVTSPMTGFSMSPLEAVGWTVGFLAPAALLSLAGGAGAWGYLGFLGVAWYGNIAGHANAEYMPALTSTRWGSRLFSNPISYHALHHARFDRHYGFATAWMDAILGTQWPDWIPLSRRVRGGAPMTSLRERAD